MKKFVLLAVMIVLLVSLVGCGKSHVEITDATLIKEDDRTLVKTNISILTNIMGYWELYPGIDAKLLDNLGNEYSVLQVLNDNFSGEIKESGVYSGTLVFPRLSEEATFLRLRIDNVRHYFSDMNGYGYRLQGNYAITFNFDLKNIKLSYIEIPIQDTKETKVVKRETVNFDRVTVSTDKGEKVFELTR